MTSLKIALIPVDHDMAVKKGWGMMPLDILEKRLNEITKVASYESTKTYRPNWPAR